MNPKLQLRPEAPQDHREVEQVIREAFWNRYQPGCYEHYLMHRMRNSPDFVPELSYVACLNGRVVGQIAYTRASIQKAPETRWPVLCFGPVSVLPQMQRQGIGDALIRHTLDLARRQGYPAVFICGDPAYYSRFGFQPAEAFQIRNREGLYAAALQVIELYSNALLHVSGCFWDAPVFEQLDTGQAELFDRQFPKKQKEVTPSQTRFLELASMVHP